MIAEAKSGFRFVIEVMIVGVLLSVGLLWVGPGPLFPLIMDDLGTDRAVIGWVTSVVPLVVALFAVPAGIVASKIGLRKTFAIGAFLMAAGLLTPFSSNFAQLMATRVVFALGAAMTFPIAGGLALQWFSGKEIPLVNGLNMCGASVGNAVAMFTAVLIAGAFTWKGTLTLYSGIALILALAWLIVGRERKSPATNPEVRVASPPISIGAALKKKTTIIMGLSMGGAFMVFMAISSWLPTYYNEVFGMPLSRASSITGLFTLFGIPACLLGGFLPMRVGLRKPFLLIPGVLIGFAALGTFLWNNSAIIYISVALFGICQLLFLPPLFTTAMELPGTSPQVAAVTIAAALAMGNGFGFTGPLIVGFLADATGSYLPGLIIASVLSWSLLIGGILLPETGPRARRPRPA